MEASSAVNTPHPDDTSTEDDLFGPDAPSSSGLPTLTAADAAAEAARYAEEKGEPTFGETAEERIEPVDEEGQPDGTPSPLQGGAEGQPAPASAPVEEQLQEAGGEPTGATPPRGPSTREYVVLHRLPLTERLLEHLLEEVKSGNVAEPRLVYLELDRQTAKNDKAAVAQAFSIHQERLGEKADLAAVTERGFKVRHVEPRQRVKTDLAIT